MSNQYCVLAHSGICIEGTGRFKPCCKYESWIDSQNAYQTNPEQLINHPVFLKIRDELSQGIQHKGCQRCWDDESNGLKSLRQSSNEKYQKLYENTEPKVRIGDFGFGNTCNAACITCESSSSHLWSNLDEHLSGVEHNKFHRLHFKPIKNTLNWDEEALNDLDHLIHGQNEVLASADFLKFLEDFSQKSELNQKTILISTNGSIWPRPEILSILESFKNCHIQISIDSLGVENDYIRYPLKWSQVEAITKQWVEWATPRKIKVTMRATVSIFNVLSLPRLKSWWDELSQGRRMSVGFCWFPQYLNPQIFGKTLFHKIEEIQKEIPELKKLTHNVSDDLKMQKLFWDFINEVDHFRKLSFRQTFPDLYKILMHDEGGNSVSQTERPETV